MKTIHKYELKISRTQLIDMPAEAEPLSIQVQHANSVHEKICMWALVNPNVAVTKYSVTLVETGSGIKNAVGEYVGTVQLQNGSYVLHAFIKEA